MDGPHLRAVRAMKGRQEAVLSKASGIKGPGSAFAIVAAVGESGAIGMTA